MDTNGELCGETVCAEYRDELECKVHDLEAKLAAVKKQQKTGACAADEEGRTVCPAVMKMEQRCMMTRDTKD